MPEHLHYDDDAIFNPETHHEKSDVNVRALLWAVVIFVVFAIVTHLLLWLLYRGFAKLATSQNKPALTSMKVPDSMAVPKSDQPRLQPFPSKFPISEAVPPYTNTPVTDLVELRAREEKALTEPAWIDQHKGIVRLPIDVAKQLVLQRGLQPATPAPAPATTTAATTTTVAPTTTGGAQP